MRGPNGTDHLSQVQKLARIASHTENGMVPVDGELLEWIVSEIVESRKASQQEIERLKRDLVTARDEIETLRMALDAAKIPQVRVDGPHTLRGPYPQSLEEPR